MLKESGKTDWGRELQTHKVIGIMDSLCSEICSLDSLTQKLCEETACRVLRVLGSGGGIMDLCSCEQHPKWIL